MTLTSLDYFEEMADTVKKVRRLTAKLERKQDKRRFEKRVKSNRHKVLRQRQLAEEA